MAAPSSVSELNMYHKLGLPSKNKSPEKTGLLVLTSCESHEKITTHPELAEAFHVFGQSRSELLFQV